MERIIQRVVFEQSHDIDGTNLDCWQITTRTGLSRQELNLYVSGTSGEVVDADAIEAGEWHEMPIEEAAQIARQALTMLEAPIERLRQLA